MGHGSAHERGVAVEEVIAPEEEDHQMTMTAATPQNAVLSVGTSAFMRAFGIEVRCVGKYDVLDGAPITEEGI